MTLSLVGIEYTEGKNRAMAKVATDSVDPVVAHEELKGMEARNLAITEAAKDGMADPRVNDSVSVYSVDDEGKPVSNPTVQKCAGFQATIPLIRKMV